MHWCSAVCTFPVFEHTVQLTETLQVAVFEVFPLALTVIVAGPPFLPVTTPLLLTVATLVSLLVHVFPWFVAFDGDILADKVPVLPISKVNVDGLTLIELTDTVGVYTLIEQVALKFVPSAVVAVIVTLPVELELAFTVTEPPLSVLVGVTVALDELLVVQFIVLFVAFSGSNVAFIVVVPPVVRLAEVLLNVIFVTG